MSLLRNICYNASLEIGIEMTKKIRNEENNVFYKRKTKQVDVKSLFSTGYKHLFIILTGSLILFGGLAMTSLKYEHQSSKKNHLPTKLVQTVIS